MRGTSAYMLSAGIVVSFGLGYLLSTGQTLRRTTGYVGVRELNW